jgi:hypothetical protein
VLAALVAVLVPAAAVAACELVAAGRRDPTHLQDQRIAVEARPIPHFDPRDPSRTRFGRLEWRGGLVLSAPLPHFGGWSGLAIDKDGSRFLAVSDAGTYLAGRIVSEGGRPTGIADARIGPIRGADGPLPGRRWRDAEAVTIVSGTLTRGEVLVAFEQRHRIVRHAVSAGVLGPPLGELVLPRDATAMRSNKAIEAVCHIAIGPLAGAVLALAERFPSASGQHVGWLLRDGAWTRIEIAMIDRSDLTDCAALPDGDVLLLERRFRGLDVLTGVKVRLRLLPAEALAAGGRLDGETLLEADTSLEIDNLEGLAVHTGARGETVLTLISDDNFNRRMQRTLLLQLTLLAR